LHIKFMLILQRKAENWAAKLEMYLCWTVIHFELWINNPY